MMAHIRVYFFETVLTLVVLILATIYTANSAFARPSKYAALVIHENTGKVLFSRNAGHRKHPASLTKIMTLYLVFEALEKGKIKLNTKWTVSRHATRQQLSKLGLRVGEKINVETAILALVTKSANDVAVVVAEGLAGSERRFARLMTRKARQLRMRRTTFRNASGLTHKAQLSTAHDMAKLARAIRKDFPQYFRYFQTEEFTYVDRTYGNHNNLLGRVEGVDGIKTGYTRAAGFNLVSSITRDGHRLVGVVFGGRTSRERDRHMRDLLNLAFKKAEKLPKERTQRRRSRRGKNYLSYPPKLKFKPVRPLRRDDNLEYIMAPKNTFIAMPKGRRKTDQQQTVIADKRKPKKSTRRLAKVFSDGNWAVQLGVFSVRSNVIALAQRADSLVSRIGGTVKTTIRKLGGKKGPLYRARLLGLSVAEAKRTCKNLRSHNMDCQLISPRRLRAALARGQSTG